MNVRGGKPWLVKFCLAFRREALSVPVTRRVLGDVLRNVGVDDDSVSDILLAATEACTNVLRHGGSRATGYAVVVNLGANQCDVEVAEDRGFAGTGTAADRPAPGGRTRRAAAFPPVARAHDAGRPAPRRAVRVLACARVCPGPDALAPRSPRERAGPAPR